MFIRVLIFTIFSGLIGFTNSSYGGPASSCYCASGENEWSAGDFCRRVSTWPCGANDTRADKESKCDDFCESLPEYDGGDYSMLALHPDRRGEIPYSKHACECTDGDSTCFTGKICARGETFPCRIREENQTRAAACDEWCEEAGFDSGDYITINMGNARPDQYEDRLCELDASVGCHARLSDIQEIIHLARERRGSNDNEDARDRHDIRTPDTYRQERDRLYETLRGNLGRSNYGRMVRRSTLTADRYEFTHPQNLPSLFNEGMVTIRQAFPNRNGEIRSGDRSLVGWFLFKEDYGTGGGRRGDWIQGVGALGTAVHTLSTEELSYVSAYDRLVYLFDRESFHALTLFQAHARLSDAQKTQAIARARTQLNELRQRITVTTSDPELIAGLENLRRRLGRAISPRDRESMRTGIQEVRRERFDDLWGFLAAPLNQNNNRWFHRFFVLNEDCEPSIVLFPKRTLRRLQMFQSIALSRQAYYMPHGPFTGIGRRRPQTRGENIAIELRLTSAEAFQQWATYGDTSPAQLVKDFRGVIHERGLINSTWDFQYVIPVTWMRAAAVHSARHAVRLALAQAVEFGIKWTAPVIERALYNIVPERYHAYVPFVMFTYSIAAGVTAGKVINRIPLPGGRAGGAASGGSGNTPPPGGGGSNPAPVPPSGGSGTAGTPTVPPPTTGSGGGTATLAPPTTTAPPRVDPTTGLVRPPTVTGNTPHPAAGSLTVPRPVFGPPTPPEFLPLSPPIVLPTPTTTPSPSPTPTPETTPSPTPTTPTPNPTAGEWEIPHIDIDRWENGFPSRMSADGATQLNEIIQAIEGHGETGESTETQERIRNFHERTCRAIPQNTGFLMFRNVVNGNLIPAAIRTGLFVIPLFDRLFPHNSFRVEGGIARVTGTATDGGAPNGTATDWAKKRAHANCFSRAHGGHLFGNQFGFRFTLGSGSENGNGYPAVTLNHNPQVRSRLLPSERRPGSFTTQEGYEDAIKNTVTANPTKTTCLIVYAVNPTYRPYDNAAHAYEVLPQPVRGGPVRRRFEVEYHAQPTKIKIGFIQFPSGGRYPARATERKYEMLTFRNAPTECMGAQTLDLQSP